MDDKLMARGLTARARTVLLTPEPAAKVALSYAASAAWRLGAITAIGAPGAPAVPARPARPRLLAPRHMPKRRAGRTPRARIALLHAVAHIELNAIDLAWDIVARFADTGLPRAFYDDWARIAGEEAKHFEALSRRLGEMGAAYGDLPAHDGLWQAADATAHDILARLAVVPLVLEARGLDVTPTMIGHMEAAGDDATVSILRMILADEIGHVAAGGRWFGWLCRKRDLDPAITFHTLVRENFKGALKPPFNEEARRMAGLLPAFYQPAAS
ncbi:MAG: ferritin-like domain-containing protein [Alphaproteobacteria bacterium]